MVNRLMKANAVRPAGMCRIRWKGRVDGGVGGGRILKYNDEGRCSWGLARLLRAQGDCIILAYDQAVLDANPAPEYSPDLDTNQHPGFFCKVCLAEGKITRFCHTLRLRGHAASHVECKPHGRPKNPPKDKKALAAYKKRKYNTNYVRNRRRKAKESRANEQGAVEE